MMEGSGGEWKEKHAKVGQQYIDNLRKSLNDELAAFAKSASVVLSYYRLKASAGCAGRGLQKQKKRKD